MKMIRPNELKEGQKSIIQHWVNQPQYVGDKLRLEGGGANKNDKKRN